MPSFEFNSLSVKLAIVAFITFLLVVLMLGLAIAHQKLAQLIEYAASGKIRAIRIKNYELVEVDRIVSLLLALLRGMRLVITFALFYFSIPLVLSLFPETKPFAMHFYSTLLTPVSVLFGKLIDFVPNLFFIGVILIFTRYLLKLIHFLFDEISNGSLHFSGFHSDWAEPTYKLVRVFIFAFVLVVIFPYLPGSGSPAFQGVSVFFGLLFSLGSSSAIGNMVAGIVLTYMRPFKLGDRVRIADTEGDVTERSLLVTRIKTIKNVDITIPNSMILGSHIINYSSSAEQTGVILHTTVTIGYDVPWTQVHQLLIQAARATPYLLNDPEPFVFQKSLDDFTVAYEINAYTRNPSLMANIYSDLHRNIHEAFNRADVEIMSPHYYAIRDGNKKTLPGHAQKTKEPVG